MRNLLAIGMLLVALVTASCGVKPAGKPATIVPSQVDSKPRETPIPFEATKENHGTRCEARYYFGLRFQNSNEGYSSFCYKLQSRLIKAADEGNLAEIRETLKYGANLSLPVDNSFPPLLMAAAHGHADAVRLLLDNGAEVNQVSTFENSPLNTAASEGHVEVVKILLARGADVCYRATGGTAADIAKVGGFEDLAQLLRAEQQGMCK